MSRIISETDKFITVMDDRHHDNPIILVKQPDPALLQAYMEVAATEHAKVMGFYAMTGDVEVLSYSVIQRGCNEYGKAIEVPGAHTVVSNTHNAVDYKVQYRVNDETSSREYTANVSLDRALIIK